MTQIGFSDLDVYPLCLGGNTFGWTADADTSNAVLTEYADSGGNFIDTADVYSAWAKGNVGGESETIIGSWMKDRQRDELVIATKVGMHKKAPGLSRENVERSVEGSLLRLQTDYIDLYYAHLFDEETPLSEQVATFAKLQKEGKIREIGLSNFTPEQVRDWVRHADEQNVRRPVALQPHYNLLWRQPFEGELSSVVAEFDLGVIPYFSLAAGLLTGKYTTEADFLGARAAAVSRHASPQAFHVVEAVREIAAEQNVETASIAIAWLLANPVVTAPIASARTPEQLPPLLEGVSIALADDDKETLDELSNGLGEPRTAGE